MEDFFSPRLKKTIKLGKKKKEVLFYNPSKKRAFVFGIGTTAFLLAVAYVAYLYFPLGKELVSYQLRQWFYESELTKRVRKVTPAPAQPTPTLPPVPDQSFSILIPKINAESKVVANVDPGRVEIYQEALKEGVAHAAGSGLPGSGKTIYLFAHSTNAQWNIIRYNAVFFLLRNLVAGDEVWLVYNKKLYPYVVTEQKIVAAGEISYLVDPDASGGETLILQTCWPPGTIFKRLLILARPK